MNEIDILKRKLAREVTARQNAEKIAEDKTREIFLVNEEIKKINESLEEKVSNRTRELENKKEEACNTLTLLNNVLNSAKEVAIIATDPSGVISIFNEGACNIFNYLASDVVNKTRVSKLFNVNEVCDVSWIRETFGDHFQGERLLYRSDNTSFESSLVFSSINSDTSSQEHGYVFIIKDITERKKVEKMQKEFISTVSHELRTPLTSISGSLEIIKSGRLGEVNEPFR